MREAVIVAAARTAIGKSPKGTLRQTRPDDLGAFAIRGVLGRVPELDIHRIDDVIFGCAMPELEQGMDVARVSALRAGLPDTIPGMTLNRFCASGLEAIATAAAKIQTGQADIIIAGGTESMTMVPFMGETLRENPVLVERHPNTYLSMGHSVEGLAKEFHITREASDKFALESQRRAAAAQDAGKFDAEIIPITVNVTDENGETSEVVFSRDEGIRRDTTPEGLAKLRTAFGEQGVITAGNASQRSDGAAAVVLMDAQHAANLGLRPLARFVGYATAAVAPERFGIAPAYALPKLMKQTGVDISNVGLIEFNEAFAAQVLAANEVFPLPMEKVNVNGGAIALGHPLGATGARQTATLLNEGHRRHVRYGVVTMCAALGMGAAALFEMSY
jgi:acetyl-CoA acyltransferase